MTTEVSLSDKKEKIWIPKISDERLAKLVKRIKPTYRFKNKLRYIRPVNSRTIAYTWDPKPAKRATGLKPLADIRTYHSFGSPNMFKPSIAEVLAQIPEEHLEQVLAFEIVDSPNNVDDLNAEREALNAGYHIATTRLYKRA